MKQLLKRKTPKVQGDQSREESRATAAKGPKGDPPRDRSPGLLAMGMAV